MIRLFTKNSTGVATDGRLYAGDINALQDAVAGLYDLTQALGIGNLAIGESGLQLLRYGVGEARLSGAMRMDGIVRALGGLYAGAFTTAARDAIGAGLAPYGLIILNTTTNRYEWNQGTDVGRNWQPLSTGSLINTLANMPSASSVVAGTTFFATDQVVAYISDGSGWIRTSKPAGAVEEIYTDAADPGYVLLHGQAWPSTIGIYADLYAKWSGKFPANLPDRQGRVGVGVSPGGKAAVDTIGKNEGLAQALRNISHYHVTTVQNSAGGGGLSGPAGPSGVTGAGDFNSDGDADNHDKAAFLVANYQAKL